MLRRRRPAAPPGPARPPTPPAPDPAWSRWRDEVLAPAAPPTSPGSTEGGADAGEVWLVAVDLAHATTWATVVVPAAGPATVAASGGGRVSAESPASARVVAAAAATLHLVPPVEGFALPAVGEVAFHVVTATGPHSRTVAEAALRSLDHPLTLLFSAVQAVLDDLRPG